MADKPEEPEEVFQVVPVEQLTPEEASRIIHSHRKVRYGTACWPCRQRKVKCDNKQPCENCVKREHPGLCSYKPNRNSQSKAMSASQEGSSTASRKRTRSFSDGRGAAPKVERQESWPQASGEDTSSATQDQRPFGIETYRQGSIEDSSDSAADRYLGQNSIPALLREQSLPTDKNERVDIRQDMRPILGLDTSAPFPLMSSVHLNKLARDISAELPSDREVMKLFRTYKEIPQPFWGFVIDIDDFESKLMVYLEDRSRNATSNVKSPRRVTPSWLAILFGVLAVGSQYHESPFHVRTRESQKYIQISFHFLRLGNFLLRPSFDSIQALLLTSFVLLNDMKAEASWALTGLTCRLAQSLGLHRPSTRESRDTTPEEAKSKDMIRRKLWWTCVWHDTLTSLSFDRSPMTNFPSCHIPLSPESSSNNYTYLETMYHLIEIISRRLNPDLMASATYANITDNCEAIERLRTHACAHIQDKEKCKTALHRLQYFAIRLHTSFIISVACRPALRRDCDFDPSQKASLSLKCKENLTETVRMFLAMHQLSVIPTRSWAFTYHGLSSALLLGFLCETKSDPEVRQLQGDLISALSATAAKESSPEPHVQHTDKDIELSGPLSRALMALKNIYEHGSVHPSKNVMSSSAVSGSGNRTPLLTPHTSTNSSGSSQQVINPQMHGGSGIPLSSDPREDAAMAMAEMQNGASLQDFSGSVELLSPESIKTALPTPWTRTPYGGSGAGLQPGLSIDGLGQLPGGDPAQYMAPMDLYDTIWGESPPDPWSTGVDSMNFDFLAQPPPGQPQQQFYF